MRTPSIRASLVALVIGCILPIAIVSAFLIFDFYKREQTRLIADSISRARAMLSVIDGKFASTQSALSALSTSHRLANGDLEGFHARAQEALKSMRVDSIVVADADGQLLLSTRRPYGEALPKMANRAYLARVLETGQASVSDLYIGSIMGRFIYSVSVPVRRGEQSMLLSASSAPSRLSSILAEQKLPDSWRAAIVDGTGTIVTRTHEPEKFLGKKANPELLRRMDAADEGGLESTTLDGIPVITVYSRSPASRWSVVLGMPLAELTIGLRQTLMWLIVATIAALGVGIALAWFIGGRVARSITALAQPVMALGSGELPTIPRLHFKEANAIGQTLLNAAASLHKAKYEAHHDALTGLANRTLFHFFVQQQLALCQRNKAELAILYIDLDGFKAVNDTHGHAVGDQLLRQVATRLTSATRDSDIAARLGGDEFAIALVHSNLENAAVFSKRLIEIISEPYRLGDVTATISASIGIAGYPLTERDSEMLLKKADQAMYKAKFLGKRQFCIGT
jgi:diguanylate cyclase (GGDEF)-like protein